MQLHMPGILREADAALMVNPEEAHRNHLTFVVVDERAFLAWGGVDAVTRVVEWLRDNASGVLVAVDDAIADNELEDDPDAVHSYFFVWNGWALPHDDLASAAVRKHGSREERHLFASLREECDRRVWAGDSRPFIVDLDY